MEYLVGFLSLVVGLFILKQLFHPVTVFEYEQGLKYSKGRFAGILRPGLYWTIPLISTIRKVDVRQTYVSITGQEVLSSDGVTIKVSLAAQYQISNSAIAINQVEDYQSALHVVLQLLLRGIIGSSPIEEVLGHRQEFGQRLLELGKPKAEELGLTLLDVEIKDVMFPGELKKIFTQVVKSKQEGLAALEKARGETAALRNLANAAQMIEKNPNLLQLRLLQVMGESSGNSILYGVTASSGSVPIPSQHVQQGNMSPDT